MMLDFNKPILTLEGSKMPLEPAGTFVTFGYWAKHVLMTDRQEDLPAEKIQRFEMFVKISHAIAANEALDLDVVEVGALKTRIALLAGAFVYGRFTEFLNGREPVIVPVT